MGFTFLFGAPGRPKFPVAPALAMTISTEILMRPVLNSSLEFCIVRRFCWVKAVVHFVASQDKFLALMVALLSSPIVARPE